ncbi:hypothetical protein AVEN_212318-1 [Araneus ventricosus]|uniref:Uncharacterized protein n=1 Tax=Araneus ventricosus TaxID=182803 RepID=A0A4Y2IB93_ARAVE|nr:hypothetical protein AVEN_212318-1 [Araneus ventricosus]
MKPISRNHPLKIGAQLLRKVLHSLYASLMSMFESDVRIVLTSMQEKGESLIGQDRGCWPGNPMSTIRSEECVLLCPSLCGVLRYRRRTKPLNT